MKENLVDIICITPQRAYRGLMKSEEVDRIIEYGGLVPAPKPINIIQLEGMEAGQNVQIIDILVAIWRP